MKAKHHLLVSIICFGLVIFEYKSFPEIMNHPYMIGLVILLCLVGYWNLALGISKGVKFHK